MVSAYSHVQLPKGPEAWPPSAAWPAAMHAGVGKLKALAQRWGLESGASPILVAVSGGADSLALAVVAAETQRVTGLSFGAVILDHKLQNVTAEVTQRAAQICKAFGLAPVLTDALQVTEQGDGLEAAARKARYDAFVRMTDTTHAAGVVTAHTADDQAEQVLLGLARGSGLRSLAGIREFREHALAGYKPINIGRPFLELTRNDTETICGWAGIQYFQDPMNDDPSISRIRVRQHLLPVLTDPRTGLGPGVFSGLVTTAALAADDMDVLEEFAAETYCALAVEETTQIHFPLRELQVLKPAILRRVVALAVQHFDAPQPSAERLAAIQNLVFPPIGRASSAGPVQIEGHVSVYREKVTQEYAKLLVIRSDSSD
ncbi:MAG: tRNA lysidine(34) synthetase TilS [Yaniella sp.]|nr:tRNA lysidine(34) synthetase TilS [Yaniella sp.]